jgi:hypothetical protein
MVVPNPVHLLNPPNEYNIRPNKHQSVVIDHIWFLIVVGQAGKLAVYALAITDSVLTYGDRHNLLYRTKMAILDCLCQTTASVISSFCVGRVDNEVQAPNSTPNRVTV